MRRIAKAKHANKNMAQKGAVVIVTGSYHVPTIRNVMTDWSTRGE